MGMLLTSYCVVFDWESLEKLVTCWHIMSLSEWVWQFARMNEFLCVCLKYPSCASGKWNASWNLVPCECEVYFLDLSEVKHVHVVHIWVFLSIFGLSPKYLLKNLWRHFFLGNEKSLHCFLHICLCCDLCKDKKLRERLPETFQKMSVGWDHVWELVDTHQLYFILPKELRGPRWPTGGKNINHSGIKMMNVGSLQAWRRRGRCETLNLGNALVIVWRTLAGASDLGKTAAVMGRIREVEDLWWVWRKLFHQPV